LENIMENVNAGQINAADLATLSLIGRGYGGYGGIGVGAGSHGGSYYGGYGHNLYAGNSVLAAEAHADGTAQGAVSKHTLDMIALQGDRFEDATRAKEFGDIRMAVANTRETLSREMGDNRVEAIRIAGDNRVELANRLADMAKDCAKCCCETQKLVIEEGTKTRELVNARALDDCQRALGDEKGKNSDNMTVNAIANAMQSQTATLLQVINNNCNNNGGGHGHGRK
jgi:hypothetical protein